MVANLLSMGIVFTFGLGCLAFILANVHTMKELWANVLNVCIGALFVEMMFSLVYLAYTIYQGW